MTDDTPRLDRLPERGLAVGLLVNPVAGLGGATALKGSDGVEAQAEARTRGGTPRGAERATRMLAAMNQAAGIRWYTWAGVMGADVLAEAGLDATVLGKPATEPTAEDSRAAVQAFLDAGVDLLVFAGGDGTARDILAVAESELPVLGIPAGVKMHSGVFATTPLRAAELLDRLVIGGLVNAVHRSVKDLDEAALRAGELRPRSYGELKVPEPGGYLQHTKERGLESEPLARTEIVAEVVERLALESDPVILGPGSTLAELKVALGFEGTLLGFDVWQQGRVLTRDADARWLLEHVQRGRVVLSFTRGQGFLIGRGNQQLTPDLLRRLGRDSIWVLGTRTKLGSLEGRPLLMDSDDAELDAQWSGLIEIISGYQDSLLYRLSDRESDESAAVPQLSARSPDDSGQAP